MDTEDAGNCIEFWSKNRLIRVWSMAILVIAILSAYMLFGQTSVAIAESELEPNNSIQSAQYIKTNLGYTGNLSTYNDVDYYKFTIDTPGKVYLNFRHEQVNSGSWYLEMLDANNNKLTYYSVYSDNLNTRSYYLRLPAGTYYVRVSSNTHNDIDYILTVNYSAEGEGYEKEWNGSMSSARAININQSYTGNLYSSNDVDYYKFIITSTTDLSVDFRHAEVQSGSWYIQLLDSNNKRLAEFSSYSYDLKKTSSLKNLAAGTYYLRISGSNSDYDYDITVVTETLIPVDYVTLDQNSLQLRVGDNPVTLKASIYPSNASNKNCIWTSSNTDIATVNDGKVTPVAKGNATITVTTRDGAKSASCEVKVIEGLAEWTDFFTNRQKSANEPWIIRFSLSVDFNSVTHSNIFVATDETGKNKLDGISLFPVPGDASQSRVMVMPPSNGWLPGTTYHLFISKNHSTGTIS